MTVPTRHFEASAWHRLIASKYSYTGSRSRDRLSRDEALDRLSNATDDAVQAERRGLPGIDLRELLAGVAHADLVNDAFCHTGLHGSRFNDTTRGAWYAADELATSLAEVATHKAHLLADQIVEGTPNRRPPREVFLYDDWVADFRMQVHTLEPAGDFADLLQPGPIPECYAASQALAIHLLTTQQSNGILYPAVRRPGSWCIACFRPALVLSPRCERRIEITFEDEAAGYRVTTREVPLPG